MADLLRKPFGTRGEVHRITPASAGWRYVGFSLYHLRAGDTASEATGDREVILVTNAHRKTLDLKMTQVDISPWFDRLVVSHDLDFPKEDPQFWQRLQTLHPFDPARTLLIDDTESVLESARDYGIAHLLTLLQPDSQLQKRLDTRFPGIHHFDEIMPEQLDLPRTEAAGE